MLQVLRVLALCFICCNENATSTSESNNSIFDVLVFAYLGYTSVRPRSQDYMLTIGPCFQCFYYSDYAAFFKDEQQWRIQNFLCRFIYHDQLLRLGWSFVQLGLVRYTPLWTIWMFSDPLSWEQKGKKEINKMRNGQLLEANHYLCENEL